MGCEKEAKHRSCIEMGNNFKKCHKYRAGDRYWLLCMEEKLTIASYENIKELINQRNEVLNIYKHNKDSLLGNNNTCQ